MSTGIESYADYYQVGALYPGAGSGMEWITALIIFLGFLAWIAWEVFYENAEIRKARRLYKDVGMARAMLHATGRIATEEELKADEVQKALGHRAGH